MKSRGQYVSAMMHAVRLSRKDTWTSKKTTSANGLRGIKKFEKVNGMTFDPWNSDHLRKITGSGSHEDFFRKSKRI